MSRPAWRSRPSEVLARGYMGPLVGAIQRDRVNGYGSDCGDAPSQVIDPDRAVVNDHDLVYSIPFDRQPFLGSYSHKPNSF